MLLCVTFLFSALQPNLQTAAEWYQKGLVVFNDLLKIMEKGLSGELPSKAME